ncbi:MAG: hypothetical protein SFU27_05160 [Thermonemataceae bacterium]|nr:hypothetical protein [Thermonemataceae bacterium]
MKQETTNKPHFSLSSFFGAVRYFLFLDSEQTKILLKKRYAATKSAEDWFAIFDNLAKFDKYADNARYTFKVLGWLGLSLGIAIKLLNIVILRNSPYDFLEKNWFILGTIFYYLFTSLFFLAIFSFLLFFLLRSVDLKNHLRFFTYPLLTILAEEGKKGIPITLSAEFANPISKRYKTKIDKNYKKTLFAKVVQRFFLGLLLLLVLTVLAYNFFPEEIGFQDFVDNLFNQFFPLFIFGGIISFFILIFSFTMGKYPKITNTYYTYTWLSFSARMADDTLLSAIITDTYRNRSTTKTNARGKIKTKTKNYLIRLITLNIGFDKDEYVIADNRAIVGTKTATKPNEKRHSFKIKSKQKMILQNIKQAEPKLGKFLELLGRAYQKMKQKA